MKKIIFTFIIITTLAVASFAKAISTSKVPVIVRTSFDKDYPGATVMKWEMTDKHDYKAEFKIGKNYGAAYYDTNGNYIESDNTIEWREVPLTGRMEIYHLGASKVVNVLKIRNSQNVVFYQVDIKAKGKKHEVFLDHEGNIVHKEQFK